eukprot:1608321-Rhodomonas_salina.2
MALRGVGSALCPDLARCVARLRRTLTEYKREAKGSYSVMKLVDESVITRHKGPRRAFIPRPQPCFASCARAHVGVQYGSRMCVPSSSTTCRPRRHVTASSLASLPSGNVPPICPHTCYQMPGPDVALSRSASQPRPQQPSNGFTVRRVASCFCAN